MITPDQVKQAAEEHAEGYRIYGSRMYTRSRNAFISGADWVLQQQRWIGVREQLPEDGQTVFICFINSAGRHLSESLFRGSKFLYTAETDRGYYEEVFSCVTHRKPLPELPNQTPCI